MALPNWAKSPRVLQYVAAGAALVGAVTAAILGWWPFSGPEADLGPEPSVWEILVSDRFVQGFIQLGIVTIALYAIASIPALILARRWMKGFGTSGLTADEAEDLQDVVDDQQEQIDSLEAENDFLLQNLDDATLTIQGLLAERSALEEEIAGLKGEGA